MFTTQRQLMRKNMPESSLDPSNPMAQTQKIMLYMMPIFFFISGINFPIGVLVYWLTTNLWTMGQQFYVIKRMPTPGSPAEKALQEKRARKGLSKPDTVTLPADAPVVTKAGGQRQQPKRKPKAKRKPGAIGTQGQAGASEPDNEPTPEGRVG
jgi:YidC/Oxa1 family membrane protein insertase